jgi:alpha-beta hydrolase superfamily lysophospholipase
LRIRLVLLGLASGAGLVLLLLGTALFFVARPSPPIDEPRDVFGFAELGYGPPDLPALRTWAAADGSRLAYRLYESETDRVLVFVHGSSYHGGGYHALAQYLSRSGAAKVVTPNLRGHYLSGRRRGDVDYIGQLEDDLRDLISALRSDGHGGPVTLGGHSSGGGLVIRFAGGAHADLVTGHLLLAPVIPTSPAIRGGDAGGWSVLHTRRLFGLLALNALGIHGFDGLPIIAFNKPAQSWDGTETLSYSYRLNVSYHPRYDYAADIRAMVGKPLLLLVGADDEAVDGEALRTLFSADANGEAWAVEVLPGVDHFGVFAAESSLARIGDWLRAGS